MVSKLQWLASGLGTYRISGPKIKEFAKDTGVPIRRRRDMTLSTIRW